MLHESLTVLLVLADIVVIACVKCFERNKMMTIYARVACIYNYMYKRYGPTSIYKGIAVQGASWSSCVLSITQQITKLAKIISDLNNNNYQHHD